MPNEPENNMDKLLKTYAQKRREEAAGPFEMHGATRNLLQSEVARTIPHQTAQRQGWRKLFSGFWPGLAWGGSMVAVLGLASLVWFEKDQELARNTEEIGRTVPSQQTPSVKAEISEVAPKSSSGDLSTLSSESRSEKKTDAYNYATPIERSRAVSPASEPMTSAAPAAQPELNRRGAFGGGRGGAANRPGQTPRSGDRGASVAQGVAADETRLGFAETASQPKPDVSISKPESPVLRSEGVSQRVEEKEVNEALAKAKSAAPTLALQPADMKTLSETTGQLALKDNVQVMKREKDLATVSAAADVKQESLSRLGLTLAATADRDAADRVMKSADSPSQALPQEPAGPRATALEANLSTRGLTVAAPPNSLAASKGAVPVPSASSGLDAFSRSPAINIETNTESLPVLARAIPQDSLVLADESTRAWVFYKTQAVSVPEGDSNAARLYFTQENSRARFRQNFNSPPYPNILTSFQVQRNGDNLSIVDADGSVYEGQMETSNAEAVNRPADKLGKQLALQPSRRAVAQKPAPVLLSVSAPTNDLSGAERDQNLPFRATGTNRSLNQKVVFTGNFLPGSNALLNVRAQAEGFNYGTRAMAGSQTTRADRAAQRAPGLPGGMSAPNTNAPLQQLGESQIMQWGRIEGKASVGGKNEYRIEAIRVGP
jgi:hypothetical protein